MKSKQVVGINPMEEQIARLKDTIGTFRSKLEATVEDYDALKEFAEYIYERREQYNLGTDAEALLRKGLHKTN